MATVRRYDRGEVRGAKRTPQGYMRADAMLTRVGVFEYRQADGSVRRELRLPDEVFHPDSLSSFALAPLTLRHPPEPLTPENTKRFQVGTVGERVDEDEQQFVRSSVVVTDAEAIKSVESGATVELSCGYTADVEDSPGEWRGLRYDGIQRNIRGNHVALVERGRAGPSCRLHLDASDAEQVSEITTPDGDATGNHRGAPQMKFKIDGIEYEAGEALAQAIAKQEATTAKSIADAKTAGETAATKAREDAEASVKAAKTDADKERARADGLQAELEKEKKARADAENPERLRAAIRARVELERRASSVLGAETKLDTMDELAVQKAVVAKLQPDAKLDGQSPDYIKARFDVALEQHERTNPAASLRSPPPPASGERQDSAEAARQRMIAASAWKQDGDQK